MICDKKALCVPANVYIQYTYKYICTCIYLHFVHIGTECACHVKSGDRKKQNLFLSLLDMQPCDSLPETGLKESQNVSFYLEH